MRSRGLGRWLAVIALLASAAGATLLIAQQARMDGFDRLLEAGCDEVEPCKALESEASARLARCALGCGRERDQQREVRHLLYRAEERRRVREHYRQSDALEGRIQETERERRIEDEERVLAAQTRAEERHHKEQLEAEQRERERQEAKLAEQRARELRYLVLMSPSAREQRLKRCHERLATCDSLIERLLDAAPEERERRRLVELNERLLDDKLGHPERPAASHAKAVASAPEEPVPETSAVRVAPPSEAASEAAVPSVDACAGRAEGCCDPTTHADCPGS